jgi:hypothetical protein
VILILLGSKPQALAGGEFEVHDPRSRKPVGSEVVSKR